MQPKLLYLSQNRETGKGSESHHPFFRSLLLLLLLLCYKLDTFC